MHFTYDAEANALSITFRETPVVLTHDMNMPQTMVHVDIDGDGQVCAIEILDPGYHPWPTRELLERYPLTVNESFFLVTLSERYLLFRF